MQLIFYSQLGKLSVEYLQFKSITEIEYVRQFEQDTIFISIVLDPARFNFEFFRLYSLCNYDQDCYHIEHQKYHLIEKCLASYGLKYYGYVYEKEFDYDEITSIMFNCHNITFKVIMGRQLFHDFFMNDGIDIQFKQFINSSRYSIGYFISPNVKSDINPFKPVLTVQVNDVLYDKDYNLVYIVYRVVQNSFLSLLLPGSFRECNIEIFAYRPGMAKGGSIPETPPLESKILENPYS